MEENCLSPGIRLENTIIVPDAMNTNTANCFGQLALLINLFFIISIKNQTEKRILIGWFFKFGIFRPVPSGPIRKGITALDTWHIATEGLMPFSCSALLDCSPSGPGRRQRKVGTIAPRLTRAIILNRSGFLDNAWAPFPGGRVG